MHILNKLDATEHGEQNHYQIQHITYNLICDDWFEGIYCYRLIVICLLCNLLFTTYPYMSRQKNMFNTMELVLCMLLSGSIMNV